MAIDSRLSAIGDSITMDIPIRAEARMTLNGYTEEIDGLNPDNGIDVRREFRTTVDGGTFWSDWLEMTSENLSFEELVVVREATIQVRYTRIGDNPSGIIEWHSIDFTGSAVPITFDTPTIDDSIFADVFPDPETQKLASNLFKKLYFRGIVPKYIIRAEDRDPVEDADYISYARTVGHFFAMLIRYFARFDNFYNDEELMRNYVRQYGVYFDESNTTLAELQYLTSHLYDEVRKRGTKKVFDRGEDGGIDGEFIRLFGSKEYNELLYELIPTNKTGWCLGQSSPMWRGTSESEALNKTREDTEDFQSLRNFYVSESNGDVILEEVGDKIAASITVEQGYQATGLDTSNGGMVLSDTFGAEMTQYASKILAGTMFSITFHCKDEMVVNTEYTVATISPGTKLTATLQSNGYITMSLYWDNTSSAPLTGVNLVAGEVCNLVLTFGGWPANSPAPLEGTYAQIPIYWYYNNSRLSNRQINSIWKVLSGSPQVNLGYDPNNASVYFPGVIYNFFRGTLAPDRPDAQDIIERYANIFWNSGLPQALRKDDLPEDMFQFSSWRPLSQIGNDNRWYSTVRNNASNGSASSIFLGSDTRYNNDIYMGYTIRAYSTGSNLINGVVSKEQVMQALRGIWRWKTIIPNYNNPNGIKKIYVALATRGAYKTLIGASATTFEELDQYLISPWTEVIIPDPTSTGNHFNIDLDTTGWDGENYTTLDTRATMNILVKVPVDPLNPEGVPESGNSSDGLLTSLTFGRSGGDVYLGLSKINEWQNGWVAEDLPTDASSWKSVRDDYQSTNPTGGVQILSRLRPMGSPSEYIGEGVSAGFGHYKRTNSLSEGAGYVVDSALDYEIIFSFMKPSDDEGSGYLRFGVEGYDLYRRKLFDSFVTSDNGTVSDQFINQPTVNYKTGVWYRQRGIIHAYSSALSPGATTNMGIGNNLTFNNRHVRYILPYILTESTSGIAKLYIWNYKIRPSVRGQHILPLKNGSEGSHSLGFLECPPLFYMYARNNNNSLSEKDILDFVDKYLLPYNVTAIINYLSNY